jgi:hypothetical protein
MEWVVKLEARSGWGEVETIEVATIKRRVVGLTAEEVGLTLAEGKEPARRTRAVGAADADGGIHHMRPCAPAA